MTGKTEKRLTVLSLLSGSGKGGADILALDIAKRLSHRGHRIIWGCPSNCVLLGEAENSGLETFILENNGKLDFSGVGPLMRFCRDENVDIVNVHHSKGRHLMVAARLLGLKSRSVFTRHCISGSTPVIGPLLYNYASDMNIAVSGSVGRSLLKNGIRADKVAVIYGGIEISRFNDDVPAGKIEKIRREYARPGIFNIGMVGRFHDIQFRPGKPTLKRHEVLFEALSMLQGQIEFNLLLVGPDESSMNTLKQMAGHTGLDTERITISGFRDDITPFYKIMDLNVLPSPAEGLGLVVIEAMAAGVPCIGAGAGGVSEIITDGEDGFLFTPGDSAGLAEKIKSLLTNDKLRKSFSANGRNKVKKLFDIEKNVLETEKVFYRVLLN